jgi:CheY-like chemotaxis protein
VDSAISVASTHRPDVVILDWVLQRGDGSEFLKWLRSRPETRDTSVIISTGLPPDALPSFDNDPNVRILPKVYQLDELNDALIDIQRGKEKVSS